MATMQEITAIVQDDMKRAGIEARHLGLAEKQDDFIALLLSIAQDMQVLADKYFMLANGDISERTDTIENICTSVDDKDIDEWLERQEIASSMKTPDLQQEQHTEQETRTTYGLDKSSKPYICLECRIPLSFPDTIFCDDLTYCKEHAPEY